jgi:hypothetical protein
VEQEILQLLQGARGAHLSAKEVGKMLDRKLFREDPNWARPILEQLAGRKVLEKDADGHYFCQDPWGGD